MKDPWDYFLGSLKIFVKILMKIHMQIFKDP